MEEKFMSGRRIKRNPKGEAIAKMIGVSRKK